MRSPLELALRWLKARDLLSGEIRERLARRGFDEAEIETVVAQLRGLKVLNDDRATQNIADMAARPNDRGAAGATLDLIRRGINPDQAEKLVQERLTPGDERRRAIALLDARGDRLASPGKAARFLSARGFSEDTIIEVIEERFET